VGVAHIVDLNNSSVWYEVKSGILAVETKIKLLQ